MAKNQSLGLIIFLIVVIGLVVTTHPVAYEEHFGRVQQPAQPIKCEIC
jgi:hypothetical protein